MQKCKAQPNMVATRLGGWVATRLGGWVARWLAGWPSGWVARAPPPPPPDRNTPIVPQCYQPCRFTTRTILVLKRLHVIYFPMLPIIARIDLWLYVLLHLGLLGCVASFEVRNDPPSSHAQYHVQLKTHNVAKT